jgi:DNA invertase Pin-like site-specific DNA recombinase
MPGHALGRVAIYLRCSTNEQTTDSQRVELQEYVAHRMYATLEIFDDAGHSGASTNRPEMKRLMKLARERKIDTVVVYKLDRWFRSLSETVWTLKELTELGISFIALKDQIDLTTAVGRLTANMLASFAEFEREIISERVRSGLKAAKAKGKRLGAKPKDVDMTQARALIASGKSYGETAKITGLPANFIYRRLNPKAPETVE